MLLTSTSGYGTEWNQSGYVPRRKIPTSWAQDLIALNTEYCLMVCDFHTCYCYCTFSRVNFSDVKTRCGAQLAPSLAAILGSVLTHYHVH